METLLSYICCIEGNNNDIKEHFGKLSSRLWEPLHEDVFSVKHLHTNQDTKTRREGSNPTQGHEKLQTILLV